MAMMRCVIKPVALPLAVVIGLTSCAGQCTITVAASSATEGAVETPKVIYNRMLAMAPKLLPDWFEPDALAGELGPDAAAAFRWVRDRIGVDAYSGVLREANGTLATGAGNAIDRSLLLARLLDAHGIDTRLVGGDLARPLAEALFERMFRAAVPKPEQTQPLTAGTGPFWGHVLARAQRDQAVLVAALGPPFESAGVAAREQAIAHLQKHVWVQALIDGRWTDLDSSFAEAEPGKVYGEARQTVDTAPPDWYQSVTIRVLAEYVTDGELSTTRVLEATRTATELASQDVFLVHVPPSANTAMGLGLGTSASTDRWAPVLILGDEAEVGQPVDFGDTEGGSGLDALGGTSTTSLVAEWLEFELRWPDGRRETSRRAIVDRGDAAWRQATTRDGGALRQLERGDTGLLVPAALHQLMFSVGRRDLRRYGSAIADTTFTAVASDANASLAASLAPLAARNAALSVWTEEVILPGLDSIRDVRIYPDSPRIAIVSLAPGQAGHVALSYDLRRDALQAVARDIATDRLVLDRKLWFAALQGALEHESAARDAAAAGLDAVTVQSTSATVTAEGALRLAKSDLPRLATLVPDGEMRLRLDSVIRSGATAVVPKAALAAGVCAWWQVAPSGDSQAVLNGLNGSMFNSGLGVKPIRPPTPPVWDIGPEMSQSDIAKEINKILKSEGKAPKPGPSKKPRPRRPAGKPRRGGNEYALLITVMATVAIVAATIYAIKWHRDRMAASAAAFDAWSAAAEERQDSALRAAGAR